MSSMYYSNSKIIAFLSIFLLGLSIFTIPKIGAANEIPDLGYPIPTGESWTIVMGYKSTELGANHSSGSVYQYAFDMVKYGSSEMTKNAQVIAPVSGVVETYNSGLRIWPSGTKFQGFAVELDHLGRIDVSDSSWVTKGQSIGRVVDYPIGGIVHLHMQIYYPGTPGSTPLNTGVFNFPDGGSSSNCPVVSGFITSGQYCGVNIVHRYNNYFADVTGDGRSDAIVVNDDRVVVRPANSAQNLFTSNQFWTPDAFYGNLGNFFPDQKYKYMGTYFADVNGRDADNKRRADAIAINYNGAGYADVTVRYSWGSNFAAYQAAPHPETKQSITGFTGAKATDTYSFADFNGDEKDDLIIVRDDGIYVGLSQGTNMPFLQPVKKTNGAFYSIANNWNYGSKQALTFFVDVNGKDADGKSRVDAVAINDDKVFVKINNGSEFGPTYAATDDRALGAIKTLMGDINGDKQADLILINENSIVVRYGQSNGLFTAPHMLNNGAFYGDPGTYVADVDGDGRSDIIASNDSKYGHAISIRRITGTFIYTSLLPTETWSSIAYLGTR